MEEKNLLNSIKKQGTAIIVLLCAILLVLTIGVSRMFTSNNESNTETTNTEYNTKYDVSMFKEITASKIKKETKDKLSVIYIGRETCGWCAAFLPNLWDAQEEYGFKTLYIDLAKIIDFNANTISDQDAFDILSKLTGEDYEGYMEENLGATPMILIIKDNKIINALTGYTEYEPFKTLLNDSGFEKK